MAAGRFILCLMGLAALVSAERLRAAAPPAAAPPTLEERWKRAAMFYNSGIYDEAAAEFEGLMKELPDDALTQKYLRQARNALSFGTRLNDEVLENRSFQSVVSTIPALTPVELLPGIGARPVELPGASTTSVAMEPSTTTDAAQVSTDTTAVPPAEKIETPAAAALTKAGKEVLYNRGVKFLNEGKNEEALRAFEKILQADPGHAPSLTRAQKARDALRKTTE